MAAPLPAKAPVVFYYPSRVVGGTEWLLIRTARALAEGLGREVAVVDWADGFLARQLAGTRVRHLVQRAGERTPLPPGCIVVVPIAFFYWAMRDLQLAPEDRLVLWALHPLASFSLLPPVPIARLQGEWSRRFAAPHDFWLARRTVQHLQQAGALWVMDEDNRSGIERALLTWLQEPLYVPVCVPESARRARPRAEEQPLRVGWLGRLSESKVRMLAHVAQDLARHADETGERIALSIVGDGEARRMLEERLPASLPVTMAGTLLGEALENWLEHEVDVLFACGTSALEAAKVGVPAVLVDECSDDALLAGYRYRWLREAKGYSLGVAITTDNVPHHPHPLGELLAQVATADGWKDESARSLAYFEAHHSLERTLPRIAEALDDSRATVAGLSAAGLHREGLARRTAHAVRRLLGRDEVQRSTA